MKKSRTMWAILGLAAVLAASPAAAQDKGIYLGGSLGYAQYKDTCKRILVPCEDHDTAWRFFGGYQFSRAWSAELGYANLGELSASGAAGTLQLQVKALDLSALGSIPIAGGLSAHGRLGIYRARMTIDQQGPAFGVLHDAGTSSGFTFGAGLGYTLWKLGLRAEWQRYASVGTGNTGEDDIDVFSVAALVRF
jgi:OOP family OmpA-OmpF porin